MRTSKKPWTVFRVMDAILALICLLAAFFTQGPSHGAAHWPGASPWQWAWLASAVFCAASAWWCWADRLNAFLKRWLARTALGAMLRR